MLSRDYAEGLPGWGKQAPQQGEQGPWEGGRPAPSLVSRHSTHPRAVGQAADLITRAAKVGVRRVHRGVRVLRSLGTGFLGVGTA